MEAAILEKAAQEAALGPEAQEKAGSEMAAELGPCENCGQSGPLCKGCELCFLVIMGEEGVRRTEKRCRERYDMLAKLYKMPDFAFFRHYYPKAGEAALMPVMRNFEEIGG